MNSLELHTIERPRDTTHPCFIGKPENSTWFPSSHDATTITVELIGERELTPDPLTLAEHLKTLQERIEGVFVDRVRSLMSKRSYQKDGVTYFYPSINRHSRIELRFNKMVDLGTGVAGEGLLGMADAYPQIHQRGEIAIIEASLYFKRTRFDSMGIIKDVVILIPEEALLLNPRNLGHWNYWSTVTRLLWQRAREWTRGCFAN